MDPVTGHVDVEETHVRCFTACCLDCGGRVCDLRTNLEASALECHAYAGTRRRMIVRNQHANRIGHGMTTSICVPLFGAVLRKSSPPAAAARSRIVTRPNPDESVAVGSKPTPSSSTLSTRPRPFVN